MGDTIRDWALAVLALLGAVFTPVAYVMGLRTEIKVLEAKLDAKISALEKKQESVENWLMRVENKLDRVLLKQE